MPRGTKPTVAVVAGLILLAGGCNGARQADYAEVSGKVTLDGAPLSGVVVTFYPIAEGNRALPYTTGTTDDQGLYKLAGLDEQSGGVVGKNRVVVNWPPRERSDERGTRSPKEKGPTIPLSYTIAAETPLKVEVKAGGPQTIDLPLKTK